MARAALASGCGCVEMMRVGAFAAAETVAIGRAPRCRASDRALHHDDAVSLGRFIPWRSRANGRSGLGATERQRMKPAYAIR